MRAVSRRRRTGRVSVLGCGEAPVGRRRGSRVGTVPSETTHVRRGVGGSKGTFRVGHGNGEGPPERPGVGVCDTGHSPLTWGSDNGGTWVVTRTVYPSRVIYNPFAHLPTQRPTHDPLLPTFLSLHPPTASVESTVILFFCVL